MSSDDAGATHNNGQLTHAIAADSANCLSNMSLGVATPRRGLQLGLLLLLLTLKPETELESLQASVNCPFLAAPLRTKDPAVST